MRNWKNEIGKFCTMLNAFLFHGDKEQREEMRVQLQNEGFDICITSYEMAIIEKETLSKINWHYLIIDEAHRIKNENSVLSKVVRIFNQKHCLLITGTPLQNNLHELWALLNYLLPDLFKESDDFDSWLDIDNQDTDEQNQPMNTIMEQLHKILRPFMLRRLKSDVDTEIPPKKEIYVECGMSEMQRTWYKSLLVKDLDSIKGGRKMRLLNVVTQLRKCCDHPYLFQGAEPGPPFITDESLINNSGKLFFLDKLLKRLKDGGSRVLIFSQMTRMLDILEDYCIYRGYQYCRIDGQSSSEDREYSMEEFNKENSSKFIFLLSTRAGGLGINLATADTVVLFDSDWNPQMDLQAQDRAHRIGQKKPVNVYRMITKGSVEEKIYQRAVKKLYLDAVVIQQGRMVEQNKSLSKDELRSMITFGAEEIFKGASDDLSISDEQLDAILERGVERAKEIDKKYKEKCQNNLLNFSMKAEESLYEFEGQDYSTGPTKCIRIENISEEISEDDFIQYSGDLSTKISSITINPTSKSITLTVDSKKDARDVYDFLVKEFSNKNKPWKVKYLRRNVLKDLENIAKTSMKASDIDLENSGKRRSRPLNSFTQNRGSIRNSTQYQSFQFINVEELEKYNRKEQDFKLLQNEIRKERRRIIKENKKLNEDDQIEPPEIPKGTGLSRKESKRKREIMSEGFPNWTFQDFELFIQCSATYGRDNIESIKYGIPGKKPDEVVRYYETFWEKYTEIDDYQNFISRIEEGEGFLKTIDEYNQILTWKTKQYKNPWNDLTFQYSNVEYDPNYTEIEDRIMYCCSALYGFGNWELISQEIQNSWEFQFDLFIRTRSSEEIGKRVEQLVESVSKEYNLTKKRKRNLQNEKSKRRRTK